MHYVVDTSVIVTRFHSKDSQHVEVTEWFEKLGGEEILVVPNLVFAEIAAAFKQCGIAKTKCDSVLNLVQNTFAVEEFLNEDAHLAAEIAFLTGCRGCDSVFVALARESDGVLVTKDKRQADSAKKAGIAVKIFG